MFGEAGRPIKLTFAQYDPREAARDAAAAATAAAVESGDGEAAPPPPPRRKTGTQSAAPSANGATAEAATDTGEECTRLSCGVHGPCGYGLWVSQVVGLGRWVCLQPRQWQITASFGIGKQDFTTTPYVVAIL